MTVQKRSISDDVRAFKRDAIMKAALELFYERGYPGTTMDAVADRLSVTKPFVYRYFGSKSEILAALYEIVMGQIIVLLEDATAESGPPSARLGRFLYDFAVENMENQMIATVFLQEEKNLDDNDIESIRRRQGNFDRKLAELIAEGIRSGEFDEVDPQLAAKAVIGMVRWIQRWYLKDGRLAVDEIASLFSVMGLKSLGFRP